MPGAVKQQSCAGLRVLLTFPPHKVWSPPMLQWWPTGSFTQPTYQARKKQKCSQSEGVHGTKGKKQKCSRPADRVKGKFPIGLTTSISTQGLTCGTVTVITVTTLQCPIPWLIASRLLPRIPTLPPGASTPSQTVHGKSHGQKHSVQAVVSKHRVSLTY